MKGLLKLANRVKYTRTEEFLNKDGTRHFEKRRKWFAGGIIALTNLGFRLCGEKVRILPKKLWMKKEARVYEDFYKEKVKRFSYLKLPALPGRELTSLFAGKRDPEVRDKCVKAAVTALAQLHEKGFFHGDTTLDNVLYEPSTGRARWVDFEVEFRKGTPDERKAAEDLRTFCCSLGKKFEGEDLKELMELVFATYAENRILEELDSILDQNSVYLSLQLEMRKSSRKRVRDLVQEALRTYLNNPSLSSVPVAN